VPGLFSTLSATAGALGAETYGLDVTGQNIANVNTPGYARREVLLSSTPSPDQWTQGAGVQVDGVRSTRDRLLERRLQMEQPSVAREGAIAGALGIVEVAIGKPGASIDARMNEFFDAASRLASDPTAPAVRQDFSLAGQNLAASFRDMTDRLSVARRDADTQARGAVTEINELSAQLAKLNGQLALTPAGGTQSLTLKDQQKVALDRLAQLIDINAIERADGGVDLSVGGGRAIVVGTQSVSMDMTSQPPDGYVGLSMGGQAMANDEVTGGALAGYLQVRDLYVPDYQNRLNDLASQVASQVNAIHTAGYDRAGTPGGEFFTTDPVLGAAQSIAVSQDVVDDPNLIVAAGVNAGGDNQAARDIAALRDAKVMDGGRATLSDMWGQLTYRVGNDTRVAKEEQASRQAIVTQVQALSDSVSGVSLDEEAMTMLRYQRAYEANAQFFRVVDGVLATLYQMVSAT